MPAAKRRLFNIKTKEVSLVDLAANLHKFIIIKRNEEGEIKMGEFKEVLEKIEKALNDIEKRQTTLEESIKKVSFEGDIDLEKVGAKFSKTNLANLKAAYAAIGKVLEGIDTDDDGKKDTEKALTGEELGKAISKGVRNVLPKEKADGDVDKKTAQVISAVVVETMKVLKKAETE